ncbi:ABC-2 family transporter protein [Candidatus Woesebacteria bacterium]|nr:ABC-2 family transporter protein [Candidatus Woesebacteria bacterium]
MKKYWKLFWHFRRTQLMKMMEYRGDFFFWMAVSVMWTAFNFFFYTIIIGNSKTISGWTYDEVLVLLSIFTMIDSFTWSVFYPNMINYSESIYQGNLSKLLLSPINSIFMILTQEATYHNVPRFFIGLVVLLKTLNKMNVEIFAVQIFLAIFVFGCAIIFLYSTWFILATLSFWAEKLTNINEIMPGLRAVYQMPAGIYTGITGFIITFIFPLGLVTTLPSEIILGRNSTAQIIYFFFFTILLANLSIMFYKFSIRKYSSVGN